MNFDKGIELLDSHSQHFLAKSCNFFTRASPRISTIDPLERYLFLLKSVLHKFKIPTRSRLNVELPTNKLAIYRLSLHCVRWKRQKFSRAELLMQERNASEICVRGALNIGFLSHKQVRILTAYKRHKEMK
jgi:hypothetical protein